VGKVRNNVVRVKKPLFVPGDVVIVELSHWPPKSDNKITRTGLYARPGLPITASGNVDGELARIDMQEALNRELVGALNVGDQCLVVAASKFDDDGKWYYLLNNSKPRGFGWTRCGFRMKKL